MDPSAPDSEESKQRLTAPLLSPDTDLPDGSIVEAPVMPEVTSEPAPVSTPEKIAIPETAVLPEPEPVAPTPHRRGHTLAIFITAVVIVNLTLAGGSGWLYYQKHKPTATGQSASLSGNSTSAASKKPLPADPSTLHYVSEPLKIEFDYPVDWRVSSSSDNSAISLASAPFQFTTREGKQTKATINISISPASTTPTFPVVNDNDVIVADSESLTYTAPTKQQRSATNISFVNSNSVKDGTIMGLFISGSFSYKQGEPVSSKDYKTVDPRIYLSLNDCASELCRQAYSPDYFTISDWHTNPSFKKAKSIFESLRLN